MKGRRLVVLAVVLAAVFALGARKETVGSGEIGLRTSITGSATVCRAGERVLVFPGVVRLLRFSARPVSLSLTGGEAITVTMAGGKTARVEASLRYRLSDPALLVKRFGDNPPERKIKAEARRILGRGLAEAARDKTEFMATVTDRVLLTARLLESLRRGLAPAGIAPLNLDLRTAAGRDADKKNPA